MKLESFLALCFFTLASCQSSVDLRCYDCLPEDASKCISPDKNVVRSTYCNISTPLEAECFVLYVNTNTAERNYTVGYYRGCYEKTAGKDTCAKLKEKYGENVSCKLCATENCNVENINDSNGSATLTMSATILISEVIFFLMFYN